jgi:hypothetical protein
VGVAVGVSVGVAVAVSVGVAVGVSVGVAVDVSVGVGVGVSVGVGVGVSVGVAVGVSVGVGVGVSVGVAVGVFVGVAVGVFVGVLVGVGVGVTSSTTTSSIVGPHGPPVVLVNVSVVILPALGARPVPSVCLVQPILVGLLPATSTEKPELVDPNDTLSVLLVGDPKQETISPAVFPANAKVTVYTCPTWVGISWDTARGPGVEIDGLASAVGIELAVGGVIVDLRPV